MRNIALAALVLVAAAFAAAEPSAVSPQSSDKPKAKDDKEKTVVSIPASQIPQRKELLRNKKVIVSMSELEPGKSVPMHRHEHDYLTVVLTAGSLREIAADQGAMKSGTKKVGRMFGALHVPGANADKVQPGDVDYHEAGYTHGDENKGKTTLRALTIEFLEPAGTKKEGSSGGKHDNSRYCVTRNGVEDKKKCVEEKYLFCTAQFCVEEVTMDPGAQSTRHTHATDHMLIAVTDYRLTDEIAKKPTKVRTKKPGEFEYIAAPLTHQLTNAGDKPVKMVAIMFE
jgi:quercetin dioxygenase-like cupin family protein